MTDKEFLRSFRDGTIAPSEFNHELHVRLGFIHMLEDSLEKGIASFKEDLKTFVENAGAESKYHETITVALLLIIRDRINQHAEPIHWATFRRVHSDVVETASELLAQHYRPDTLFSDSARNTVIEPDLQPLPLCYELLY